MIVPIALAESTAKPPVKPHFIEQIMPFVFIFLLFYFLLIRPAQKRNKQHQEIIANLKKGDQVLTSSGIIGTIQGLTKEFVTLEVAENVRIKIVRSQIASLTSTKTS